MGEIIRGKVSEAKRETHTITTGETYTTGGGVRFETRSSREC